MKYLLLIGILLMSVGCSSKAIDNKKTQHLTRSQYILQNIDSLITHDTLSINLELHRGLPHNNVGNLYDIIADNEGADGGRILSLKKFAEIYEKIEVKEGDTIYIFDHIYFRTESGVNLKTYVFSSSECYMSYNGERAYLISENNMSGLRKWINKNRGNSQSEPTLDGATYVADYLFQVVVKDNEYLISKCQYIPSRVMSASRNELLSSTLDSIYQTSWIMQENGNVVRENSRTKKRNNAYNRLNYSQANDDIYFIEDLYNYECWALWSQKELIYCYNGRINVYSKPSAKLEKLFDNYQEQDISAVLSDRTINIFPNRKNFKSTFFVAKIRIRDSKPDIIYVKRFNGYF